jgi:hypothetical protein
MSFCSTNRLLQPDSTRLLSLNVYFDLYDFFNLVGSNDLDAGTDVYIPAVASLGVPATNQTSNDISGHKASVGKTNLKL